MSERVEKREYVHHVPGHSRHSTRPITVVNADYTEQVERERDAYRREAVEAHGREMQARADCKEAVEALGSAEEFLATVTEWKGTYEEELAEQIEAIREAVQKLASYTQDEKEEHTNE